MKYPRIWIAAKGGPVKVAGYEDTPVEILDLLAADKNGVVRWMVAGNEATSKETLRQLAGDRLVCSQVAENPNTPVDVLRQLAVPVEGSYSVRHRVAARLDTPDDVLLELAKEKGGSGDVASAARSSLFQKGWRRGSYGVWTRGEETLTEGNG